MDAKPSIHIKLSNPLRNYIDLASDEIFRDQYDNQMPEKSLVKKNKEYQAISQNYFPALRHEFFKKGVTTLAEYLSTQRPQPIN